MIWAVEKGQAGGREKEREQLPGSGRSWHHHLWAPRVALGARQSQPVPGRPTAYPARAESRHTPSHRWCHQKTGDNKTIQHCTKLQGEFCTVHKVLRFSIRGQNRYGDQWKSFPLFVSTPTSVFNYRNITTLGFAEECDSFSYSRTILVPILVLFKPCAS